VSNFTTQKQRLTENWDILLLIYVALKLRASDSFMALNCQFESLQANQTAGRPCLWPDMQGINVKPIEGWLGCSLYAQSPLLALHAYLVSSPMDFCVPYLCNKWEIEVT
jgi:hypothetical protein